MHTSISPKSIILTGIISVFILSIIGYLFLKDYNISVQKKSPDGVACTMEAKLCPDGSAVGRMPPSCEFAPCPGESNGTVQPSIVLSPGEGACTREAMVCPDGSTVGRIGPSCEFAPCPDESGGGTSTVSTGPIQPGQSDMAKIPDLPLGKLQEPSPPLTVTYTVEHRTALNEKRISITGIVVANYLNNSDNCQPGKACTGMYMAPGITIADTASPNRNPLYDLRVIMTEDDRANAGNYSVGNKVTLMATVSGNIDGITLTTGNGY